MPGDDCRFDALVVGDGIVGLTSALEMARRGRRVGLFAPDIHRSAASWGNAGHIAIEQVQPLASPATLRSTPGRLFGRGGAIALPPRHIGAWLPFATRLMRASGLARYAAGTAALSALMKGALPAWRALAAGLPEGLLVENGHVIVWETAKTARNGRAAWTASSIGEATIGEVPPNEAAALARLTDRPGIDAIRFGGTAQITDLDRLGDALRNDLTTAGAAIVRASATLDVENGVARVTADGARYRAPIVLVAAGVGSRASMVAAGHGVPIIAERGYHIRARDHDWPANLPPVVFEDRSMIVTRYETCLQAASFVEFARTDAPPDPRKWARLEQHVAALGLPMRGPFVRWMGARPTLPDYLPAIGRSSRAENLLYAFGHQHLGLTLAPVTAQIVAALADGAPSPVDLAHFAIERFG